MEGSVTPHVSRFRSRIVAAAGGARPVVFGPFRLDADKRVLTADGQEVALQPRAFDMLELFVACRGQVLSGDEIVGHVWRGIAVGDNNLGVQLSALRRALAAHGGKGLIVTLPGRGYRFVGDVAEDADIGAEAEQPLPPKMAPQWRRAGLAAILVAVIVGGAALAWRPAPLPTTAVFNPPPHSIAVLAFANLSSEKGQDYLSDGLSEALIDVLGRVNELRVTARTSSFSFKGKAATIGEIARRLDVGSVLEGSLRRQGNHLRIDAHLSDARTGYQIWSQSYDLEMDDMLRLQDEIAGAVADALQTRLLDTVTAGHSLGGTTNPQAFDAYLRAEHHMFEMDDESTVAPFAKKRRRNCGVQEGDRTGP